MPSFLFGPGEIGQLPNPLHGCHAGRRSWDATQPAEMACGFLKFLSAGARCENTPSADYRWSARNEIASLFQAVKLGFRAVHKSAIQGSTQSLAPKQLV